MPCAATATPSPTCCEDRRHKRAQVSASAASMRGRAAKSASAWTGCRQTCVAPAVKCARRPRLIVLGITPQYHRIDKPVTAAVGQLSLGKALTEPAIAIIRQACSVTVPCVRAPAPWQDRFKRDLLLHHEPLRRPEDRGRLVCCGVTLYGTAPRT